MMDRINGSFIRLRQWQRGQTMTEYAMVAASIAVAVLSSYLTMGAYLKSLLNAIDIGLL